MNRERMLQVLLGPLVSEKSSRVAEAHNQVVFRVAKNATKLEIRHAVEQLFNVKVESVNTLNVKGKQKVFGRMQGKRSDWKKAYVNLAAGQDIDFVSVD